MASSLTIEGFPQLQRRLKSMAFVGSRNTMAELGQVFVEAAQQAAPEDSTARSVPPKHPGALRRSIHVAYAAPRAVGITAGGPEAPYAQAQEFGAREHPIPPNRAKRLAFFWVNQNKRFIGRVAYPVQHPGNEPQPFFFPTLAMFAGAGLGAYFRAVPTKTITLVEAIRVDLVNHWNAGA